MPSSRSVATIPLETDSAANAVAPDAIRAFPLPAIFQSFCSLTLSTTSPLGAGSSHFGLSHAKPVGTAVQTDQVLKTSSEPSPCR